MKILMLHGLESTPGGSKSDHLAAQGHTVVNPELPRDSWERSLEIAQAAFAREQPDVVVGASRGGAVAANLVVGATPLVLIAPAWRRFGSARTVKPGTWILHSPHDDVVLIADSHELVRASGLPPGALISVGADHRMKDPDALAALAHAVIAPQR